MVPKAVQARLHSRDLRSMGFVDLVTFSLDEEFSRPTNPQVSLHDGNPTLWAEDLGIVKSLAVRADSCWGDNMMMKSFSSLVRLAVRCSGTDVDAFVDTIGSRMYAQSPEQISSLLRERDARSQLQQRLKTLSDSPNPSDEHREEAFAWIAEAMGFSNYKLAFEMSPLTPLNFLEAHGGTAHLGRCCGAVPVECPRCVKTFPIRLALYCQPKDVVGARAYRIPGLKFRYTLRGGCGLLLKDKRVVGRFLWGTPTCECDKLTEVEVILDCLPQPTPNTHLYGRAGKDEMDEYGWIPVDVGRKIKSSAGWGQSSQAAVT